MPKSSSLKAAYTGNTTILYVENIDIELTSTKKGISNDVRSYVNSKDIKVLDAFVILNKYRSDKCGCKLTIPTKDIDLLLDDSFWPHGICCRMWEDRSKNQNNPRRRYENNRTGAISFRENRDDEYDAHGHDYEYERGHTRDEYGYDHRH